MFVLFEFKKVLKEDDMINPIEGREFPAEIPASASPWIQITFRKIKPSAKQNAGDLS